MPSSIRRSSGPAPLAHPRRGVTSLGQQAQLGPGRPGPRRVDPGRRGRSTPAAEVADVAAAVDPRDGPARKWCRWRRGRGPGGPWARSPRPCGRSRSRWGRRAAARCRVPKTSLIWVRKSIQRARRDHEVHAEGQPAAGELLDLRSRARRTRPGPWASRRRRGTRRRSRRRPVPRRGGAGRSRSSRCRCARKYASRASTMPRPRRRVRRTTSGSLRLATPATWASLASGLKVPPPKSST